MKKSHTKRQHRKKKTHSTLTETCSTKCHRNIKHRVFDVL